ncbi:hypothetical protein PAHAL_1G412700 [Panicum hallii]|uniref:Uncharacterized protein n=1 Tax=Panicum hallii TaxID=206008 RepID=A0A2T8KXV4_9POAL|nr:hypothetical protein PAHAL_1G412700 [Panicum hallii]
MSSLLVFSFSPSFLSFLFPLLLWLIKLLLTTQLYLPWCSFINTCLSAMGCLLLHKRGDRRILLGVLWLRTILPILRVEDFVLFKR